MPSDDRLGHEKRVARAKTLIVRNRKGVQGLDPERLRLLEDRPRTRPRFLDEDLSVPPPAPGRTPIGRWRQRGAPSGARVPQPRCRAPRRSWSSSSTAAVVPPRRMPQLVILVAVPPAAAAVAALCSTIPAASTTPRPECQRPYAGAVRLGVASPVRLDRRAVTARSARGPQRASMFAVSGAARQTVN